MSELTPATEAFLKESIRTIPDFPIPGIAFKDITTLLAKPRALSIIVEHLVHPLESLGADAILAVESRGFIVGAPVAAKLGISFIPVRKPGKLPGDRDTFSYTCEYCTGTLEVSRGAVTAGRRYIIMDDLLATGGTARATADYVQAAGGQVVAFSFLVELLALDGRARLIESPVHTLLRY